MRFAIILLVFLCSACTSTIPSLKPYRMDIQQGNVINSKMMSQLRPGMTKSQVKFILGTPLIQDSFHSNRWDYFYQMRKGGQVIEQRRVILDFENDLLKGVRGDVIPAKSDVSQTDGAPIAELANADAKSEEKKGLVDKLKFWDKDSKPAESPKSAKPEEAKLAAPAALVNKPSTEGAAVPVVAATAVTAAAVAAAEEPKPLEPEPVAVIPPKELPAPVVAASSASPEVATLSLEELTRPEVVTARVNAWADAWRNKDVAAYLQFYSDKFVPDALPSKKAWVTQRKQRLAKPGKITLELDNLKVSLDGQSATAEFTQKYSVQGYSDNVIKVIKLNLERGKSNGQSNWFIVKESAIAEVALPPVSAAAAAIIAQKMPKEAAPADSGSPDATGSDNDAVVSQVNAWADAWRSKDIDSYLTFYADKFIPEGVFGKKAWVAQRKQRLSKPGAISLDLDGVKASVEGKQAKVTFVQRYSANGYNDNVSKVLLLQLIDNKWLIVKESVASKLIKIDAADSSADMQAPKLTSEQKSEAMPEYPSETPPVQQAPEVSSEPIAAPVQEVEPAVSKPKVEDKSPEVKNAEPESQPSFFERMLEKIGF